MEWQAGAAVRQAVEIEPREREEGERREEREKEGKKTK